MIEKQRYQLDGMYLLIIVYLDSVLLIVIKYMVSSKNELAKSGNLSDMGDLQNVTHKSIAAARVRKNALNLEKVSRNYRH